MKKILIYLLLTLCSAPALFSQSLTEARELYLQKKFDKALPVFEAEYKAKPNDANINQWYGACLVETGGDMALAEKCLLVASKKNIQDSNLYLGKLYGKLYRFDEATEAYDAYEKHLTKKNPRKKKEQLEQDKIALEDLEKERAILTRLRRMATNVENIQVIDSIVVDKNDFLSAYKMNRSAGKLKYFDEVFETNIPVKSTVYLNEKETKLYFSQPDKTNFYTLFSMEKLIDGFGNEKALSASNFGLLGDINYPFVMSDGVTIYFAAADEESLGGYDLFISRYSLVNDTYLTPERMNMPFNSDANDYMLAIDEEKGIGWFASDRFQLEGKVCVYTFIPSNSVKIVESEDESYIINRARLTSIKDTWEPKKDYDKLIEIARSEPVIKEKEVRDFEFVINDENTYYRLADFQNVQARDLYFNIISMKKDLNTKEANLEKLYEQYSKAASNNKSGLSTTILNLEKEIENQNNNISKLEKQVRRLELGQ